MLRVRPGFLGVIFSLTERGLQEAQKLGSRGFSVH